MNITTTAYVEDSHSMKFPSIVRIAMADVLRDGGSYFLLLEGKGGQIFTLRLPVKLSESGVRTGYGAPSFSEQATGKSHSLNWNDAADLAQMLVEVCTGVIAEGGARRAKECIALLAGAGSLSALPTDAGH